MEKNLGFIDDLKDVPNLIKRCWEWQHDVAAFCHKEDQSDWEYSCDKCKYVYHVNRRQDE